MSAIAYRLRNKIVPFRQAADRNWRDWFYEYRRLAAAVFLVNAAILATALWQEWWSDLPTILPALALISTANFALGILIRQQYLINILFWLATRAPVHWPLSIRWALGKVYHFGGLHSGGTISGAFWFLLYAATFMWARFTGDASTSEGAFLTILALAVLLVSIIAIAYAPIRARYHNLFERTHRFGGWTALGLFWSLLFFNVTHDQGGASLPAALAADPVFWLLTAITVSILIPWLHLKKVMVEHVNPSDHAIILKFDYGDTPFPGSSNAISRQPLLEWHSFANIPTPGTSGYRLVVSRAGDWTGQLIDDPPDHLWVKGITTSGVARIEVLFKRVVYVATGSGIGPVLPHLLAHDVPTHLIWATRNPRQTYGDDLVNEILDHSPDAIFWDTDSLGRPDLVSMAVAKVRETGAEAVICISNPKVTWRVVNGVERAGIPGYGAIWDS